MGEVSQAGRRRPSMADVGRHAEVSAQTVSRYFTGGYVSAHTRTRIVAAIEELGYRQNRLARNMRSERTDVIGVLSMGPVNYGNSSILTGLSTAAVEAGVSLIMTQLDIDSDAPSSLDEVRGALDNFLSFKVDGIIVGTPYLGTENLLSYIGESAPVVTLSDFAPGSADSAFVDSYGAGRGATEYLVALGHRRILHLAGPTNRNESAQRRRGYHDALAAAGLPALPVLECTEWTAQAGAEHGREVDPGDFTAVVAANDLIALGFSRALADRGRYAPADFSLIGVDDMPETAYYSPALTTMGLDFVSLGTVALGMIRERVMSGQRQEQRVLPAVLRVRESTRALAAGEA